MSSPSQLRSDVALLVTHAERDLAVVFRDIEDPATAATALHDVLPALIDTYGAAAATISADWYEAQRDRAGVPGRFAAITADIKDSGANALVGWALSEAADVQSLKTLIAGGAQRRIANFSRQTVMQSSVADPKASGWQRVSQGGCSTGFCDMLAGRGAVYSEATADFAAHDHCQCYAEPAFDGEPRPVKPYTPSLRNTTDADRARVRAWLRDH